MRCMYNFIIIFAMVQGRLYFFSINTVRLSHFFFSGGAFSFYQMQSKSLKQPPNQIWNKSVQIPLKSIKITAEIWKKTPAHSCASPDALPCFIVVLTSSPEDGRKQTMATIESVWDLRPTSSPRSIAVYPSPLPSTSGIGSSGGVGGIGGGGTSRTTGTGSSSSSSSNNPFASPSSTDRLAGSPGGSAGVLTSNPFDDAALSSPTAATAATSASTVTSVTPSRARSSAPSLLARSADSSSGGGGGGLHQQSAAISVVIGTERGALHRRTYKGRDAAVRGAMGSSSANVDTGGGGGGGGGGVGSRRAEQPLGGSGSGSGSGTHPLHKPIDLNGAVPGAIVALVSTPPLSLHKLGLPSASHSVTSAAAAASQPVFMLLVDDNRSTTEGEGLGRGSHGNPGACASHLVTISTRSGKFDKLLAVNGADESGSPGGGSGGGNSTTAALPPLPRASCASYHPRCGYVYAAGRSVISLPSAHILAVAHHLAGLDDDGNSGTGAAAAAAAGGGGGGGGNNDGSSGGFPSSSSSKRGLHVLSSVSSYRGGSGSHGHHQGHHHGGSGGTTARRQEQQLAILKSALPRVVFDAKSILPPSSSQGARSGPDAMCLTCGGRVAVVAVGNGFYAVSGRTVSDDYFLKGGSGSSGSGAGTSHGPDAAAGAASTAAAPYAWSDRDDEHDESSTSRQSPPTKVLSFAASGRVHPAVAVEIPIQSSGAATTTTTPDDEQEVATSLLFLASGRECAAVEILHDPRFIGSSSSAALTMAYSEDDGTSTLQGPVTAAPPRNGVATLVSPILAAVGLGGHAGSPPLVAILTSDGLVQTRSPSCLGVPLATVEVGNRPNDFFTLRVLPNRKIVAASYSGEGRVLAIRPESPQDLADRLMTLSIDAFGQANFPRTELAEAISASYGATSYAGHAEPTMEAKALLRQYLEAILGLADGFGDDGGSGWEADQRDEGVATSASTSTAALLTGTALLCKICSTISPPKISLANRAARACSNKMGIGVKSSNAAAVKVCQLIAEDLLKLAESKPSTGMTFIEPAVWLLRACGSHDRAIEVVEGRMNDAAARNKTVGGASGTAGSAGYSTGTSAKATGGGWSQLRFESFVASHLSDLWASRDNDLTGLVLSSKTTLQLLEQNPRLGLGIFTSGHPQNEKQWEGTIAVDDPLAHPTNPRRVIDLLKGARPSVPLQAPTIEAAAEEEGAAPVPLTSGRALAITYLESAVGISTGRPVPTDDNANEEEAFEALPHDRADDERIADLHDELAYLLLEGVISERGDSDESDISEEGEDSELGALYRGKLRRFLSWPNARVRSETLLSSVPPVFRRERALLLGRLGRHDDALRILYCDLRSLDMALEYCDARYEQWQAKEKRSKGSSSRSAENADGSESDPYLPLVKVALESGDRKEGVEAAVKVLSSRRDVMDCGTALRLLPGDLPMSAIARPFLIPAVVDGDSAVRRMKIVAALLRARYNRLRRELTEAQIESQANLRSVPALKSLGLGDLIHSSKPFRARPVHATSSSFPDITIIRHFFPRYLVIQAKITNSAISAVSGDGRALGDVSFVVAESSDEALTPTLTVPLKTLPTRSTGSVWCALAASPQRLDDIAVIACELRYTVLNVDAATGAPLNFGGGSATVGLGHTYVEELQDLEVRPSDFE